MFRSIDENSIIIPGIFPGNKTKIVIQLIHLIFLFLSVLDDNYYHYPIFCSGFVFCGRYDLLKTKFCFGEQFSIEIYVNDDDDDVQMSLSYFC